MGEARGEVEISIFLKILRLLYFWLCGFRRQKNDKEFE
jgi:hypothetical protein